MKYLLIVFSLCNLCLIGQDTIKVEPSRYYSSSEHPIQGKQFYSMADRNRAKEIIVYSKNHIRIDNCFYYDKDRRCFGDTYHMNSDSTIVINQNERWQFNQSSFNSFKVSCQRDDFKEIGQVSSLIPFVKTGIFHGLSSQNDTLWSESFIQNKQTEFKLHKKPIEGKVFEMDKLNIIPLINGKDTIPPINIKHVSLACCEGGLNLCFLSFIVTKSGEITNISISGTNTIESKQVAAILGKYKNVIPGKKKGKAVNTNYYLELKLK